MAGIHWQPSEFVVYFEQSIISVVDGCYFHYTQSLWKRVGEFGLIAPYKNDKTFRDTVMSLRFLHLLFVARCFDVSHTSGLVWHRLQLYPVSRFCKKHLYFKDKQISSFLAQPVKLGRDGKASIVMDFYKTFGKCN